MRKKNGRRRRAIRFVAAEVRADRGLYNLVQIEQLEQRQLLSSITAELVEGPERIEDVLVIRDDGHDGTITVAWNDSAEIAQSAVNNPQFIEYIVEYEVRLTNEGQTISPNTFGESVTSGDVEFSSATATNTRKLLRRDTTTRSVEVSPGMFEQFSSATSYSLGPGVYSFAVRYRFLSAFLGDPGRLSGTPSNGLATQWSEWSADESLSVIPIQQAYILQAPAQIQKTGEILDTGHTQLAQQRHRLAWGFEDPAESFEVWISRRGVGRVFHDPALKVSGLDINSDFAPGNYRVWVKANPAKNILTGWSPPLDFEIVDGSSAFLVSETHPPNEPLRLEFGYTGVHTGELQVTVYDDASNTDQPVIDVSIPPAIVWTIDKDGLPSGNYRVVVQQSIDGTQTGPTRESALRIEDDLTPMFRGNANEASFFSEGTVGQINTLSWRSGSSDAFDLWIAYDGPAEGRPTSSQHPQFRFIDARISNTGSANTQFTLPTNAPAGQYRAWVRGVQPGSADGENFSRWTKAVSFTLRRPSLNVTVSTDAFHNSFATVDWDEIPDTESYSVEIRKSNAVFRQNGLPSYGLARKFDTDSFSNPVFFNSTTEWSIPFHMQPGHYVARVSALLDSGETVTSEAFFSHRIPAISGISEDNGVVTVNMRPEESAAQYQFFVSYLGDGQDKSSANRNFFSSVETSPTVRLPANAMVGTYRVWGQARISAANAGSWSEWSAPADFVISDELTITSTAGVYTQLPPVTWDSTADTVRITIRDSATDELLRTEAVHDADEWLFTDAEEGRSYKIVVTAMSAGDVAGQQRITWLMKRSQPVISFDQHLSKRVSWTWLNGVDRFDVWVAQDSSVDPNTGAVSDGNFRYLVRSRVPGNKVFLPEDAPNGAYRAWVRTRDAADQPSAWTSAFSFEIQDPPATTVVHPPGVQQELALTIIDYFYSPIDRVSALVPESIPDPEQPSVVAVHRFKKSADQFVIEWHNSSEGGTERFVTPDGLLVAANQIHEVEVILEDVETGDRVSLNGQPLPNQTGIEPSGRVLVKQGEDRLLPETLTLPSGTYSVSLRYRTLRTIEHDPSLTDKTFIGTDGVQRITGQTLADNGLVQIISTDWSQFSPLYVFTTDPTTRPVIRPSVPTVADFAWTAIPNAPRYEVFLQEESSRQSFRRFVDSPEFNGRSLNPEPGTTWRAWVRVFSPDGKHGPWSASFQYYLETPLEGVQDSNNLAAVQAELSLTGET